MLYADNDKATQADYDTYYKERYGYGVTDDEAKHRIALRAIYIREHFRRHARIVDFGGGEAGLTTLLRNVGFTDLTNHQVGDIMPADCDVIIAEHVLEHIYDLETSLHTITSNLKDNGYLIVDVPDAAMIAFEPSINTPQLDFSQVHINHFRMVDMLSLMDRFGYELRDTLGYKERMMHGRMYIFVKSPGAVAELSKDWVVNNIARKVDALRALGDRPVIVWGLGDIAMNLLAMVKVNVKYYVCNDPAFKDATIDGVLVKEKPDTDDTILIMAQTQKKLLIDNIRKMGIENQIIEI
jgi:hypothetical protein